MIIVVIFKYSFNSFSNISTTYFNSNLSLSSYFYCLILRYSQSRHLLDSLIQVYPCYMIRDWIHIQGFDFGLAQVKFFLVTSLFIHCREDHGLLLLTHSISVRIISKLRYLGAPMSKIHLYFKVVPSDKLIVHPVIAIISFN